jgi:NAD(P)-dependent dehydrogenase (short-subunit alcohol dehydrogenase family)
MLEGSVVVVSGAAGTIGSAVCTGVVEAGGLVVASDIDDAAGERLVTELGDSFSTFVRADVTSPEDLDRLVHVALRRFGRMDSAVHAAYPASPSWGARFEDLRPEPLALDLFGQLGGAILFSQRMIQQFRAQGHGNLIHLSSIQGIASPKFDHYVGTEMTSPVEYTAIKAGIVALTRWLAKYHKDMNIRVNCVSPGGIRADQPESFIARYRSACTNKGMLDPSDVASTVLFLLSDGSSSINGQNIVVDDGWSL